MRYQNVYSSKNVVSLTVIFCVIFWLLYSIGSFLHEERKISNEIEAIRQNNEKIKNDIAYKQEQLEYLKTPQRIEKEAKMQMGKKREGEQVLVFIEEKLELLPTEQKRELPPSQLMRIPIPQKWRWVFFGGK